MAAGVGMRDFLVAATAGFADSTPILGNQTDDAATSPLSFGLTSCIHMY
jgi:hypothetical protein